MKKMPDSPKNTNVDDSDAAEAAAAPDAQSLRDALKQWRSGDSVFADIGTEHPADSAEPATTATPASSPTDTPESAALSAEAGATEPVAKRKVSRNQARRYARQRTLQALYQWDHGAVDASEVLVQFREHQNLNNVDVEHFHTLFRGVAMAVDDIDSLLEPALDRPIADLDPVERSVLRMAACEFRDCPETPARVVINEAVELTKRFGADQGHKYVNGVIDKVALSMRTLEMKTGAAR